MVEHRSVAAGVTGSIPVSHPEMDIKIFYFFNSLAGQSVFWDYIFIFLARYLWYLLITVFLVHLFFNKQIRRRQKIFWFTSALVSTAIARGIVAEVVRFFYHNPRPFVNNHVVRLISENSYSFPSGHAIFFFALATIIFFYNKRLAYWLGGGGIVMSLARIIAGVHWPSDILGGIVLGILISWGLHRFAFSRYL